MRITTRIASALLTTTLAVGAGATMASAETASIKDKTSDVISYPGQSDDERGTQLGYADSVASGVDLRSLRIKHSTKTVAIRVKFANLAAGAVPIIALRLDGANKPSRYVVVSAGGHAQVITPQGRKRCTAPLTGRLGNKGYLNVVIKRSCLGTPKRIKASAYAATEGYLSDKTPYVADGLSPKSVRSESWTSWVKAG